MAPTRRLLRSLLPLVTVLACVVACSDDGDPVADGSPTSTTAATSTTIDGVVDEVDLDDCPPGADASGVTPPSGGDPGSIRVVTTHAADGAFAGDARISYGAQARFAVENRRGGVEVAGQRYLVEVSPRNDAADPVSTRQHVADAFDPEGTPAFAAFGMVGTENVLAVRDQLARWCVPDVFPVSSSAAVSVVGGWSVGAPLVLETTEAWALVRYVSEVRPDARMALLVPAGARGDRIQAAFEDATRDSTASVVAVDRVPVAVDTDVRSRVSALAATEADVFVNAAELLSCPAAMRVADELSWPALVLAAGGCASSSFLGQAGPAAEGVLSATNLMDPANERWADNDRMADYHEAIDRWNRDHPDHEVDPNDQPVALGWTMGELFLQALAGSEGVTRSELMASLTAMTATEPGLVLDGITLTTGPADRWLGEAARVVRFDADTATNAPVGAVADFEGGQAVPVDLRPGA
ncbi:MAG: ABC transporter substrate-binding protein [Acidimicrobiales bacterium]|nr:ABC transporter substrate-binding protein [Acidimicrobiales bacterium]